MKDFISFPILGKSSTAMQQIFYLLFSLFNQYHEGCDLIFNPNITNILLTFNVVTLKLKGTIFLHREKYLHFSQNIYPISLIFPRVSSSLATPIIRNSRHNFSCLRPCIFLVLLMKKHVEHVHLYVLVFCKILNEN